MLNQELLKNPEVREILNELLLFQNGECYPGDLKAFIFKYTKPPILLTTEDGVEVTDGDQPLYIATTQGGFFNTQTVSAKTHKHFSMSIKIFSTEAARGNYILLNRPCFSAQDILDFLFNQYGISTDNPMGIKEAIKSMAQSKQTA